MQVGYLYPTKKFDASIVSETPLLEMSDSRIRPTAKNCSKDKAKGRLKTGRAILPQPPPSFPRRRESRPFGTETYRIKGFFRFHVLDSRLHRNDGR